MKESSLIKKLKKLLSNLKNMQSQKQRLKRQEKKKKTAIKKVERRVSVIKKVEKVKSYYQKIKEQKQAETKIIAYIFQSLNKRFPDEGESLDSGEVKELCERFIKEKPAVEYYDVVAGFAKKKIAQIKLNEENEKKLKKLTQKNRK